MYFFPPILHVLSWWSIICITDHWSEGIKHLFVLNVEDYKTPKVGMVVDSIEEIIFQTRLINAMPRSMLIQMMNLRDNSRESFFFDFLYTNFIRMLYIWHVAFSTLNFVVHQSFVISMDSPDLGIGDKCGGGLWICSW